MALRAHEHAVHRTLGARAHASNPWAQLIRALFLAHLIEPIPSRVVAGTEEMKQNRAMREALHTRSVEINSLDAFDERFAIQTARATIDEVVVQGLDLRGPSFTKTIVDQTWARVTFLGCRLDDRAERHAIGTGATIFPPFDDIPYDPYRGGLYTTAELARDDLDRRIYEHQARYRGREPKPILEALAQRIHDHAIDDALEEYLAGYEKVVAIMGGHSMSRDREQYRHVVELARGLARAGFHIVTGGGPGAMEAGNLGAWLAPHDDAAIDEAIATLSLAVDYRTQPYVELGVEVAERFADGGPSLAIPTWFYGHEPTNAFATAVAKYFSNSIREDGLLAIATHGVVYAPGMAGTVQEVFMDATQNHYATFGVVSPMVFLDSEYWGDDGLAAPNVLRRLAGDRPYAAMIGVFDDPGDVVEFIRSHPPHR